MKTGVPGVRLTALPWALAVLFALALADGLAQNTASPRGFSTDDERNTMQVFQASAPAVVFISSHKRQYYPFSRRLFDVQSGAGTGLIWDRQGHVVTNYHVIAQADQLQVTLQDGTQREAQLVGAAPDYDLAVLRIPTTGLLLHVLPLGDSARLRVGRKVLAIGNPFGFDTSLSVGVISALDREINTPGGRPIRNAIQTDAAINRGNSGGPLINSNGELIGLNAQIYSPSGASAGIGFAIPVNTIQRVVPLLIRDGRVQRAIIGVTFAPDEWNRRIGVASGVPILRIYPGTPAQRAGLQALTRNDRGQIVIGDVIVAIDGEEIQTTDELLSLLEWRAPGDRIRLSTERNGRRKEHRIVLMGN